jgi:hypothetical protein
MEKIPNITSAVQFTHNFFKYYTSNFTIFSPDELSKLLEPTNLLLGMFEVYNNTHSELVMQEQLIEDLRAELPLIQADIDSFDPTDHIDDMEDEFDEFIDDMYSDIDIFDNNFTASDVLKTMDSSEYRQKLYEYVERIFEEEPRRFEPYAQLLDELKRVEDSIEEHEAKLPELTILMNTYTANLLVKLSSMYEQYKNIVPEGSTDVDQLNAIIKNTFFSNEN